MKEKLYDAMEVCLAALDNGVNLRQCLSLFPDLASDLQPAMEAALAARSLREGQDTPSMAIKHSRSRLWARATELVF